MKDDINTELYSDDVLNIGTLYVDTLSAVHLYRVSRIVIQYFT